MEDESTEDILAELSQESTTETSETPRDTEQPQPWSAPDWAQFDFNGKRIAPDSAEKAKTWIAQGYNYSQRAAELNKTERAVQQRQREWDEKIKRWEEVDEYAQKNPQWWEHVEKSWTTRDSLQQPTNIPPEFEQVLKPIQEKLGKYESVLSQWEQEREQQNIKLQEEALDKEIDSIRTKHPNIDLSAVDATGRTVEQRVYAHATENNIPTFRAAFYDLMSDQLLQITQANGREAAAKAQANQAKAGIIGQTPTPVKGQVKQAQNYRSKSWDDLAHEALEELKTAR